MMKVYLHVGPAKTGTSAIQNWLSNNVSTLMQHGIYYPQHELDNNGVSSGNVLNVFVRDENKKLHFSPENAQQTLDDAIAADAKILLLSSEFFFSRLDDLLAFFPKAIVISYLRDPLDANESGYNQSVKRHFQRKKHGIPDNPKTTTFDKLREYWQQYSEQQFVVRPYHFSVFYNGSIVSDFLSVFNLAHLSSDQIERINSSYTFEALEFKRWFNQFPFIKMHRILDRYLQGVKEGCIDYSVLTKKKRKTVREKVHPKIKDFCEKADIVNSDAFLVALKHGDKRPYRKQVINSGEFKVLLEGFLQSDPLAPTLMQEAIDMNREHTLLKPQFLDLVQEELAQIALAVKKQTSGTYKRSALFSRVYRKLHKTFFSDSKV